MDQQLEASTLGLVVLGPEIMFVGGRSGVLLFALVPGDWGSASNHLNFWMAAAYLVLSALGHDGLAGPAALSAIAWFDRDLIVTILFAPLPRRQYFEYAAKFEHHLVPGRTSIRRCRRCSSCSSRCISDDRQSRRPMVSASASCDFLRWPGRASSGEYYGPLKFRLYCLRRPRLDLLSRCCIAGRAPGAAAPHLGIHDGQGNAQHHARSTLFIIFGTCSADDRHRPHGRMDLARRVHRPRSASRGSRRRWSSSTSWRCATTRRSRRSWSSPASSGC